MAQRPAIWLWAEFVGLYVVAPTVMAVFLPPRMLFPGLFLVTALGLVLLARTPGFQVATLRRGPPIRWGRVLAFALITLAISAAVMLGTRPDAAFDMVQRRPLFLLVIAILYPLLSALPQELIFRVLYFSRYGPILPTGGRGLALNAALFSFAHLMYWSGIVAVMTFAGGLVFAWAYARRGSFALAVVLHSVAGVILFAAGLGIYFYSGNVVRPF